MCAGWEGVQLPAVRHEVHLQERPHQAHEAQPVSQEDLHPGRGEDGQEEN